jgi:hypothetical protein
LASIIKRFVFAKYRARCKCFKFRRTARVSPAPSSLAYFPVCALARRPAHPSTFLFSKTQNAAAQGANRSLNLTARAANSAAKYCKPRNEILKTMEFNRYVYERS